MDGTPLKARQPISPEIARLVAEHRPGGPLERDFYVAPEVFEVDLARIFHRHWVFAGYAFQVVAAGRLLHLPGGHRIDHRGARPATARSAPSTMSAAIAARGSATTETRPRPPPGLPLSPLDLRARRLAGARHAPRVRRRQGPTCRCKPGVDRRCRRAAVRLPLRRPAGFLRRARHHPPQDDAARHRARQDRPPGRLRRQGQLEDRVREQPRVLPLPAQPQGIQHRGLRRAARRSDARSFAAARHGRHRGARQRPLPRARPRRGRRAVDHDRRLVALPPHAGDGRLRDPEHGRQAAVLPDGRHQGMGLGHACAPPCSPISGSTPIATTPPPRG